MGRPDGWPRPHRDHHGAVASIFDVTQGQTLIAWRGGRRSSVTLILGGGRDAVNWMEAMEEEQTNKQKARGEGVKGGNTKKPWRN